ncbi:DUF1838 family protein [Sphingorhabdus contaminans]|uniref:DUF1838 domain-containing protein n=1 Tax=Sphingorhabdus contaminans TaxID=1343899 RepID=A0A553WAF8_9SPHN|nr:DUF1838 family protein [Sphingorhabdus contaminans]TSB01663.1 DUF1838 domain-containing protein [Sphingorhabdus contaminans]
MKSKSLLLGAAILAFVAPSAAAKEKPRMLDLSKAEDALEVGKRAQCGEADGKPAVYHWSGKVYSRVTGEPDRMLFLGEGMNIRTCVTVDDPKRGKGWRLVSREIMLYLDPKTGEVLRKWTNPWTDETVDVMHIANDPVNQRPQFATNADGTTYKFIGRREGRWIFAPFEAPLFYHNVLAGDYQDYIGGKYHAMEIFDFAYDAEEILNTKYPTAYPIVSWVRISDWMPWMKMRGRQGQMVFNAMGNKLKSFDELPAVLKDEIRLNYPAYIAPPPGDDARPNETTWTVFKKMVDENRAKTGEKPKTSH